MAEAFDIKVQIIEDLKKGLIFGLGARLPIGLVLGFTGFSHEVLPIMQTLSHSTRAYLCNANGLQGFIIKFDILKMLTNADKNGQLESITKYQTIDLSKITQELEKLNSLEEKMNYFSLYYPCLFWFICK